MRPQLLVNDIEQSISFYTNKPGFELEFRYEDLYVSIIKDDCSIHLKPGKPTAEERKNKKKTILILYFR